MIKIPCLFERDFSDRRNPVLLRSVTPGCEWAVAGEGVAYRKRDGTACMVLDDMLFRRYDAKGKRMPPPGSVPCMPERDPVTGHWPHWVPVGDGPEDRWYNEGWRNCLTLDPGAPDPLAASEMGHRPSGTYELCGPKVNGNHERLTEHGLIHHKSEPDPGAPRDWEALRDRLRVDFWHEGLVFHHPDGRMCKIRRRDFGFAWPRRD